MSAIDILILAVGGCALVLGYIRGIVAQVGQIVAVVAGVVVSRMFGPVLSGFFAGGGATSPGTDISGYIVAFVAAYLAVWLIFRLARRTVHGLHLGIVDRAAGAVFKAALWLLALSMALNVWMLVRGDEGDIRDSGRPWRGAVVDLAPVLLGYLTDIHNNDKSSGVDNSDTSHK